MESASAPTSPPSGEPSPSGPQPSLISQQGPQPLCATEVLPIVYAHSLFWPRLLPSYFWRRVKDYPISAVPSAHLSLPRMYSYHS